MEKTYPERMAILHKRNMVMVSNVLKGATFASQARINNISGGRVDQIFRKTIRSCIIVATRNKKPFPEETHKLNVIRNHSKEWLALLAKL